MGVEMGKEALLLFVRWPMPGTTKTHLIPVLGENGAAEFYQGLAERVAETARSVGRAGLTRFVYFEPPERRAEIEAWMGSEFVPVAQPDLELSGRFTFGFDHAFAEGAERVLAIGSDCDRVTPQLLCEAFGALEDHDAVVGPSTDGGYWAIGLARPAPEVFADVPFGSALTLASTLDRMAAAGMSVHGLPTLPNVDRPEDIAVDWRS
jgi:rSAM/selenodomain-associated transferase 1